MFFSRKSNNLINKVRERSLRIVSGDNYSIFKRLLSIYKEITIHQRNLQELMTETFKIINGISPPIMNFFFMLRENTRNVRNFQEISNENNKTVKTEKKQYQIELHFFGQIFPMNINWQLHLLEITNWHCDKYVCRLCQNFQ